MAAVEVTISGVLYDKVARTTQPVVIIGEASLTGLGIGGGPIQPPAGGGDKPPGIWGPGDPRPQPPIANVPGVPPSIDPKPPGIWGGGNVPMPQPPISNVPGLPPTTDPPPIDPATPPVTWKPLWTPTEGWVVVGVVNPDIPHPVPSDPSAPVAGVPQN